jgi:hypothetical protein
MANLCKKISDPKTGRAIKKSPESKVLSRLKVRLLELNTEHLKLNTGFNQGVVIWPIRV